MNRARRHGRRERSDHLGLERIGIPMHDQAIVALVGPMSALLDVVKGRHALWRSFSGT